MSDSSSTVLPQHQLVPFDGPGADESPQNAALTPYAAPVPGRTWRSLARFSVLVGGSALIGIAVATGGITMAGAYII
jgi:hypothetical protein